jgi:hypothetical protein
MLIMADGYISFRFGRTGRTYDVGAKVAGRNSGVRGALVTLLDLVHADESTWAHSSYGPGRHLYRDERLVFIDGAERDGEVALIHLPRGRHLDFNAVRAIVSAGGTGEPQNDAFLAQVAREIDAGDYPEQSSFDGVWLMGLPGEAMVAMKRDRLITDLAGILATFEPDDATLLRALTGIDLVSREFLG